MTTWLAIALTFYIRPVPDRPTTLDPRNVHDLFSYATIFQVHASLFRMDGASHPQPYLVSDFTVSPDQLIYNLKIKEAKFHNGSPLLATDVKASIEDALRQRVTNYDLFQQIAGFQKFIHRKTKQLEGIVADNKQKLVKIILTSADPDLIFKLTDIRFAITKPNLKNKEMPIGVGPYKYLSGFNSTNLKLARFENKNIETQRGEPLEIELIEMTPEAAKKAFKIGAVDDLVFYSIFGNEIDQFKSIANVSQVYFPRTYTVILNSRSIKNHTARKAYLNRIDTDRLVNHCYSGQTTSRNLVPPGFVGHDIKLEGVPSHFQFKGTSFDDDRVFKLVVIDSIGSEECVVSELKAMLGKQTQIRRVSLNEFVKLWKDNSIDGYLAYIEGETTATYFGSFSPTVNFSFGDVEDREFDGLLKKFQTIEDPVAKSKSAQKLSAHILSRATVKPLFHAKTFVLYKKQYKPVGELFTSAALTPLTKFQLETK